MKEPAIKANVPPPPRRGSRLTQEAPAPVEIENNLADTPEGDLQDLNFKVDPDFHYEFKLTAYAWNMTMKDLLQAAFDIWKEKHGSRPARRPTRRRKSAEG